MLERFRNLLADARTQDTLKVTCANWGTLAVIHLTDFVPLAQLGLITLSAAYTLWKWRRESKNKGPQ